LTLKSFPSSPRSKKNLWLSLSTLTRCIKMTLRRWRGKNWSRRYSMSKNTRRIKLLNSSCSIRSHS
jgi:hypothetical protein